MGINATKKILIEKKHEKSKKKTKGLQKSNESERKKTKEIADNKSSRIHIVHLLPHLHTQ